MLTKPFDVSKFRKSITKNIDGISVGFSDPTDWISTGNYALNYLISGSFFKGIPLGKVTMFAGESGCLPDFAKIDIRFREIQKSYLPFVETNATVEYLGMLFARGGYEIEIQTPDGWQPVVAWYNKGTMDCYRVDLDNGLSTVAAHNHLVEIFDADAGINSWLPVEKLSSIVNAQNIFVITKFGNTRVKSVAFHGQHVCYDFTVNHPNHRYWGDNISSHNSGKSYICSGNLVAQAQRNGVFPIIIDTENALDQAWLQRFNIDVSDDKIMKVNLFMIDDVAKVISEFMKEYKAIPEGDKPKVLFVLDSIGMLLTPSDVDQFEKGDLKGDMGRRAKALTALVRNCVNTLGNANVGLVVTNHTYASQNIFDPDDVISGGQGFIYASSIVVAMRKLKLKEDEEGNKTSDVKGIRAQCKVMKTRFNKPFETVEIKIPWETGMDPYSGLVDLFESRGVLLKTGNKLVNSDQYNIDGTNKQISLFRKEWEHNENNCLDKLMKSFMDRSTNYST